MMIQKDRFSDKMKNYIIVSYKMIGINTYNIFIIDMDTKEYLLQYWYEIYQLWESDVTGFLLDSNDFLILSKEGKSVVGLGDKGTNTITDYRGFKVKLHSLGSVNFLKIEPSNHIFFSF
jgi:hypothetical protein